MTLVSKDKLRIIYFPIECQKNKIIFLPLQLIGVFNIYTNNPF